MDEELTQLKLRLADEETPGDCEGEVDDAVKFHTITQSSPKKKSPHKTACKPIAPNMLIQHHDKVPDHASNDFEE
jgi:hypothetical protein